MGVVQGLKGGEMKVAVVVGGANTVLQEVALTRDLLGSTECTYFVCNSMIPLFAGPIIAVTLHPMELRHWLSCRELNGHPKPLSVWAHELRSRHVPPGLVTHAIEDWHDGCGLFGARIALHLGFNRIILCGVPMQAEALHFRGHKSGDKLWVAAQTFIARGWLNPKIKLDRVSEIKPFVRSWGGWTGEQLGVPTKEWLHSVP